LQKSHHLVSKALFLVVLKHLMRHREPEKVLAQAYKCKELPQISQKAMFFGSLMKELSFTKLTKALCTSACISQQGSK
jgi:hypothetical protein